MLAFRSLTTPSAFACAGRSVLACSHSPMSSIHELVLQIIPAFCPEVRPLLVALAHSRGHFGTAEEVAAAAGFRNRYKLHRVLVSRGMPSLEQIAAWIRVVAWTADFEVHGLTPCRRALGQGLDPAPCYRTVKRITGRPWGEVSELGVQWVLEEFVGNCGGVAVAVAVATGLAPTSSNMEATHAGRGTDSHGTSRRWRR